MRREVRPCVSALDEARPVVAHKNIRCGFGSLKEGKRHLLCFRWAVHIKGEEMLFRRIFWLLIHSFPACFVWIHALLLSIENEIDQCL